MLKYIEGLSVKEAMKLSPREFAVKHGCITIKGMNRLADDYHILLVTERLDGGMNHTISS